MKGNELNGKDRGERGNKAVLDEEGGVDQRIKQRILESRERVDEREDALFTVAQLDPEVSIDYTEAVIAWGNTVRQYLRNIKPLLRSDEIPNSEFFYTEIDVGEMTLTPPDTGGYPFSNWVGADRPEAQIVRALELPPGTEIPTPTTVYFVGLQSVLNHPPTVSEQWEVCVDGSGPPPEQEWVRPSVERAVEKRIYANAVEYADSFLQQAGVGLEVGHKKTDDPEENAI